MSTESQFTYPLVSVIVPVYNTEKYLDKCIESIRDQTYHNLEIILIDDGSTDNSYSICEHYQSLDSRIKLIHKENEGNTKARKDGLSIAAGEYVGWVDSDDWVDPDYFENMVEAVVSEDVDLICVQSIWMERPDHTWKSSAICPPQMYSGRELLERLIWEDTLGSKGIYNGLWTKLFRRKLLMEIMPLVDDEIMVGEDSVIVYGAVSRSGKVKLLDCVGYHYRQRSDSVSRRKRTLAEKVSDIRLRRTSCQNIMPREIWENYEPLFWKGIKRYYLYKDIAFFDEFFGGENICLWPFQGGAKYTDRIALYGAGKLGKAVYSSLMDRNIEVTAWVAAKWRRYQTKGLPVEARKMLKTKTFDKVVVANEDKDKVARITEYLEGQSIPKEKILCLTDKFLDDVEFMKQCLQASAGKEECNMKPRFTYDLDEMKTEGRPIVLYGAGKYGRCINRELQQRNIIPECFCDNDPNRRGAEYGEIKVKVLPFAELPQKDYLFIVSVAEWPTQKEIIKHLSDNGVSVENMLLPLFYGKKLFFDERILMEPEFADSVVLEKGKRRKQAGRQFADYFLSNDLRRILIYGDGILADWLVQELAGSDVIIVDRVTDMKEITDEPDAIVVANQAQFIYIEEELMKIVDCPIIDVWNVVR